MIGEDESGYLPSANMFLGGVEGHHGWGKDAVNWYVEAHDTRTNMSRTNYSYTHHIYKDGYYQQGIRWVMRWAGMVNSLPVRLS
jgi:hypothetical protein